MAYLQLATFKGSYGANWATLASDYTAGGTSWVLTAGHGARFPANGVFWARLGNSNGTIKRVTARSTDTLTVDAAAADGTTDQDLAAGGTVDYVLGQAALEQAAEDANRILTVAQFDALASHEYKNGDQIRLSDSVYTVRRSAGAWVYEALGQVVTRPPSSSWTWDNQGAATASSAFGPLVLSLPRQGATQSRWYWRTAPATPYTIKFKILYQGSNTAPGDNTNAPDNWNIQVGWRESTAGKGVLFNRVGANAGGAWYTSFQKWTSTTSSSASYKLNPISLNNIGLMRNPLWGAIRDDGTNLLVYWSHDGLTYQQFDTQLRGDWLTTAGPDQVLVGAYVNGSKVDITLVDWTIEAGAP